jgi:hypothetical protein
MALPGCRTKPSPPGSAAFAGLAGAPVNVGWSTAMSKVSLQKELVTNKEKDNAAANSERV